MNNLFKHKAVRIFDIPPNSVSFELRFFDSFGDDKYHPHTGEMSDLVEIYDNEYVEELEKRNREMSEEIDRLRFKVAEHVSKEVTAKMLEKK